MTNRKTIIIVIYGCLGRSYCITKINHQRMVFDVLLKHNVDWKLVYVDNKLEQIDGVNLSPYAHFLNPSSEIVQLFQQDVDEVIQSYYAGVDGLFSAPYYSPTTRLFALRNSYLESEVASYLNKIKDVYEQAIVFNADFWFGQEFDFRWLSVEEVIVGDQNPAFGYTNGFYSGKSESLAIILNSFASLGLLKPIDFENLSLLISRKHNIPVLEMEFRFLKIRATGDPGYQSMSTLWPRIRHIAPAYFLKARIPLSKKMKYFFFKFPVDASAFFLQRLRQSLKQIWIIFTPNK